MAPKSKKINVGLIGCNSRALWYGAIFGNIDPNAYACLDPATYHHLTYYREVELRIKRARGFRLAKLFDHDTEAARRIAAAFRTRPRICADLRDVSDDVELVIIANESGDGKDHLRLATPGLRKGVPTFIDRPFAATVKDAKAMTALAKRKRTPLLSCSHMRMLPHVDRFKTRFKEIGPIEQGIVQGHGPNPAHMADGTELALCLFGDDFKGKATSIQSMGNWPLEMMHICFSKPNAKRVLQGLVVNSHTSATRYAFWAKAVSMRNAVDSPNLDAFVQVDGGYGVLLAVKKMLQTGKAPLSPAEMIESVAVTEAGRRSHNKPRAVPIKPLR